VSTLIEWVRVFAAVMVGLFVGVAIMLLLAPASEPLPGMAPPAQVITQDETSVDVPQEDDPRWDCRTMGNRVCGSGESGANAPGSGDER